MQQGGHTSCLILKSGSFNVGMISVQVAGAPLPCHMYCYCLMQYQLQTVITRFADFLSVSK